MNLRRFLAEAGALAGLAIVCALVSNALAGKERKLALPGNYPNATKVTTPAKTAPPAPFESEPAGPAPAGSDAASFEAARPFPMPAARPAAHPGSPTALPSPPPVPKGAAPAAELLARFPPHRQPWAEITGEAAVWLHARGALFLDARRSKDFASGHTAGARSFPVWESDLVKERVEALVAEGRDGALPVVLYCSGGDCEDSHLLAQILFGAGFENLLVYRDGFPDWVRRSGAVATGGAA